MHLFTMSRSEVWPYAMLSVKEENTPNLHDYWQQYFALLVTRVQE
jgi:hypothetical protein